MEKVLSDHHFAAADRALKGICHPAEPGYPRVRRSIARSLADVEDTTWNEAVEVLASHYNANQRLSAEIRTFKRSSE